MTTFALTGATGLVGSHLLFEIIKQHLPHLHRLRIVVFGRHKGDQPLRARMEALFEQGGYSYLGNAGYDPQEVRHFLRHQLVCVDLPLDGQGVVTADQLAPLRQTPIDFFFHLGALADLRTGPGVADKVMRTNYNGTRRLLDLVAQCEVQEFGYVGTAFVSGKHSGTIVPDFVDVTAGFNNPYEHSKWLAEMAVREFAGRRGLRFRVFRPSIVSGRLMEAPLGYISKFDVFYQLFGALYVLKALRNGGNTHYQTTHLPLRLVYAPGSSANFVPVDYLVKLLYQICRQQAPGDSFHLVHDHNTLFGDFMAAALEEMGIRGVQGVGAEPLDKTTLETLYYNRVGGLFEAYANASPKWFDTSHERPIIRQAGLQAPAMNHENIKRLIRYAVQQHFGLPMGRVLAKMTPFANPASV